MILLEEGEFVAIYRSRKDAETICTTSTLLKQLSGINKMTDQEIKELAENALHQACSFMQDALNQKYGDIAGVFFTGEREDEIHAMFQEYIKTEILFRELPTD
jgi:hypothetical protein